MLLELSFRSAVATVVGIGLRNRERLQQSEHPEKQLPLHTIHAADAARLSWGRHLDSARRSEMESLLVEVRAATEKLVSALAAESLLGGKLCVGHTNDEFLFEQWQLSRSTVETAHEVYDHAVDQYREFVRSLPPLLRADAVKRGGTAQFALASN